MIGSDGTLRRFFSEALRRREGGIAMGYDAQKSPNPEEWNALEEGARLAAIIEYHENIGEDAPNLNLHAAIHAIVENQIALGEDAPGRTLNRLTSEGLDRHDAVHAIGSVLSEQIFNILNGRQSNGYDAARYNRKLAKLTAKKWRKGAR
jgi:hypothetical protein